MERIVRDLASTEIPKNIVSERADVREFIFHIKHLIEESRKLVKEIDKRENVQD